MPRKALSAIVAVVLLLMMTVGAAGLAYVFISGLQKSGEESTQGQLSSIQEAISSCMTIDSVYSNKVYLRNCGDGMIDNASLKVYMDDEPISLSMSPSKISKGEVGTVSLYGIWDLAPYTNHKLKIGNEATSVSKRVSAEPRKDDLVGGWDFDDGSGTTARDWSGNGNGGRLGDGTCQPGAGNCPSWVSGKVGSGLSFDGGDYVEQTSFSGLPSSSITVSAWVKINAHKNWNRVINHEWVSNGWLLYTDGAGIARFGIGQSTVQYNAVKSGIATGIWYYFVGVYDGTNVRLSVDNVEGTPTLITSAILDNTGAIDVGGKGGDQFNGIIDDVRIYSKALTPDELVNLKAV